MSYFVHYTVIRGKGSLGTRLERLTAGPYTMDEALAKRRELDRDEGSSFGAHIEEKSS